jgi:glutaminyl-peptide cyclotransferase
MRSVSSRASRCEPRRYSIVFAALLLALAAMTAGTAAAAQSRPLHPADGAWSSRAAMQDIRQQLTFGRRAMGWPGHDKTLAMIRATFARMGVPTSLQTWTELTPTGPKQLTNVIARFSPADPRRIVLGTHYDSIVRAYADPLDPRAPMPGANNSASGVALLLETARTLHRIPAAVGVDFIFFDGEEGPISLGAGDPHWHALGSPHFVKSLAGFYPHRLPEQAILFDMVCYRAMQLDPEASSLESAPSEVRRFWSIGEQRAPSVFVERFTHYPISDDQSAFQSVGVPSFLVIGFDYAPYFNTTADTIDKCSPDALQAVGDTLITYVRSL